MESTLFTTLTVNEEANLSGGWKKVEHKPKSPKPPVKKYYPTKNYLDLDLNVVTVVSNVNVVNTGKNGVAAAEVNIITDVK